MNGKKLPVDNITYLHVLNCTDDPNVYAALICTFLDAWAEAHGIDRVKFADHIAAKVRKKVEGGQQNGI